jgi:hypothetical protein
MTRTISLITATVGAALLFAVPAVSGNYDRYRMYGPGEHAVAANDDQTVSGNYDRYRMYGPGEHAVAANDDQTVSGTEIEWPQLGIGFGLAMLILLGLFLVIRATRTPSVAH